MSMWCYKLGPELLTLIGVQGQARCWKPLDMATGRTKASAYTRFCTRVLTVQGMVIVIVPEVLVRLGEAA